MAFITNMNALAKIIKAIFFGGGLFAAIGSIGMFAYAVEDFNVINMAIAACLFVLAVDIMILFK